MDDFTYQLPFSNERLVTGILSELKRRNEVSLQHKLKKTKVSIDNLGTSFYVDCSGRWNAQGINIKFYVNPSNIDELSRKENVKILFDICENFIPGEVGFDLKNILFVPDLSIDVNDEEDILKDLEFQIKCSSSDIMQKLLPEDIRDKGIKMAEVYSYLYSVENSLRLFIEIVGTEKYGENYMTKIKIPKGLEKTISSRKESANERKWLSLRGDSDLFYLDFKDIGAIINNNWDIFEKYFVSQGFILPKIEEMAECRNLIAHNSYISKVNRDLMRTYYNSILNQIESKF